MVSYEPTVAGNIRKHERDIRKLGTAPLGPVSLGPGDHIRPEGSAAFRFDQSGAYLSHRGVLSNLSDLTDDFASSIEDQAATIASNTSNILGVYNTVTGHGTRLSAAESTIASHSGSLAGMHATLGLHGGRLGTAESRLAGHDATLSSHDGRISKAQSDVVGVYNTVGEHDGRITTARSAAATAQSRADAAHDRIDGLNYASPGDIATLSNQVQALRSQVHDWMQTARASNPSLPPPIPN